MIFSLQIRSVEFSRGLVITINPKRDINFCVLVFFSGLTLISKRSGTIKQTNVVHKPPNIEINVPAFVKKYVIEFDEI